MKNIVVVILVQFTYIFLFAQTNQEQIDAPAFGIISKEDLKMKECDFDENAAALVLLDDGIWEATTVTQLRRRPRIKILNTKGLEWANVHLKYRSENNLQNITRLEALTYNLDDNGNITESKVESKFVYEKKINKRFSEKIFTFPNAKVGSVIEYEFVLTGVGLLDWYFQRGIPVKFSRFVLDFPNNMEVTVTPHCAHQYETRTEKRESRVVKTFTIRNIPSLQDGPFVINEDFYRDRLTTQLNYLPIYGKKQYRGISWQQVIEWLMEDEDFGRQIKRNLPHTSELDSQLQGAILPYEKMKVIYNYVQTNMEWNEYEGIWAFDGVRSAWKNKKGTVGEINLILVNLLKDADLNAHPILVSTHDNGIINTLDPGTYEFPGYLQFNKVMAFVRIADKEFILDATSKYTPPHLIPPDVLMTQGLIIEKVDKKNWGWKTLSDKRLMQKNIIITNGTIDVNGKLHGETIISSYDYSRLIRLPIAKKGGSKFQEKFILSDNPDILVEEIKFENIDSDTLPLIQKIKFIQPLKTLSPYQYFSTNLLSGLEKNPFVADNRTSDVFFGCNQSYMLIGNFTLPEGYEFDELPKNIKMILPDTSITFARVAQVTGDKLMTRIQMDVKKPIYEVKEYPALQEFYKRLYDLLNEQFVIRKKQNLK